MITLTADLTVLPQAVLTLTADLDVTPAAEPLMLSADLTVRELGMAIYRRAGGHLQRVRILRRADGVLRPVRILRRQDGELYPQPVIPPPAPAARKPYIGAGGGVESLQYTPLNTAVGPMVARRSYDGALPPSWAASAGASDVAAGRHSYWSWKPDPVGFKSNTGQQAAFSAFLDTIPAGHKVTIFCHHEPENNMADFGGGWDGLQGWGQLQNVVADVVRSKSNPDLRFGPCFMGPWTWDSRSSYYQWINQWALAMDWTKFDVIGIDPYNTTHPGGYSFERILTVRNSGSGTGTAQSMMQWLAAWNIPIVVAEWGYYRKQPSGHSNDMPPVDPIPDERVAAWIVEAYDWFVRWNQDHPIQMVDGRETGPFIDAALWFNYTLTGSDNCLTGPLTSPAIIGPKIDAYRAIVTDSKLPL